MGRAGAGFADLSLLIPLLAAVVVGGQIGARLGSNSFSTGVLCRVTAALVFVAAVRLLLQL